MFHMFAERHGENVFPAIYVFLPQFILTPLSSGSLRNVVILSVFTIVNLEWGEFP
jgi:hypothetical protein